MIGVNSWIHKVVLFEFRVVFNHRFVISKRGKSFFSVKDNILLVFPTP
jgi:hypothetical protein